MSTNPVNAWSLVLCTRSSWDFRSAMLVTFTRSTALAESGPTCTSESRSADSYRSASSHPSWKRNSFPTDGLRRCTNWNRPRMSTEYSTHEFRYARVPALMWVCALAGKRWEGRVNPAQRGTFFLVPRLKRVVRRGKYLAVELPRARPEKTKPIGFGRTLRLVANMLLAIMHQNNGASI
eukprot:1192732-Prorocentrum_minimum.AAC.3